MTRPLLSRRRALQAGAATAAGLTAGLALPSIADAADAAGAAAAAATDPAQRKVVLVGANPGVQLFDGDTVTAYASVWTVDWSTHGAGAAIVLWHDGRVRVLTDHPALGSWLERAFTRFFPEAEGLPWPEPRIERRAVHVANDLARGTHARGGDVAVRISGVQDRRAFATDEFDLGGRVHSLSLVTGPSAAGSIEVRGRRLPGEVVRSGTPDRPSSSAFVAVAEVWRF
ncbi:twin-arginine translocation signal domain-containing protein [Jiangella sp. DSM 45060]|uniref:twin-arginine translocation signal domain-containing protein n=1 Tax=Jiangella sp. DSM 45060 TaxID=1798224 RepID=UPI00087A5AEA|nr:twin-arginine translocation signal domain-containing protein [Jiangella sp. DSM 45060]SDS97472.1 Tat (twin-arginine translocation) pathway signal sequence [Jiangella sp. DSM 45060]